MICLLIKPPKLCLIHVKKKNAVLTITYTVKTKRTAFKVNIANNKTKQQSFSFNLWFLCDTIITIFPLGRQNYHSTTLKEATMPQIILSKRVIMLLEMFTMRKNICFSCWRAFFCISADKNKYVLIMRIRPSQLSDVGALLQPLINFKGNKPPFTFPQFCVGYLAKVQPAETRRCTIVRLYKYVGVKISECGCTFIST